LRIINDFLIDNFLIDNRFNREIDNIAYEIFSQIYSLIIPSDQRGKRDKYSSKHWGKVLGLHDF